jgi:hypothetical protein
LCEKPDVRLGYPVAARGCIEAAPVVLAGDGTVLVPQSERDLGSPDVPCGVREQLTPRPAQERLVGDNAVFAIGFDANGAPGGLLHFVVVLQGRALSLASMPRHGETPTRFNEWLVVETIGRAGAHGLGRVSMNFSPGAELPAPGVEHQRPSGASSRSGRHSQAQGRGFHLERLLAFRRTLVPLRGCGDVVHGPRLDLPRVGLASLAAEGHLPLVGSRR